MATLRFTEGQDLPPTASHQARQLLPNIVDGMAYARADSLYALIPNSFTSYEAGYRRVSYANLANAVNGAAWLIHKQLGQGNNSEALAYAGPNDIGYVVFILGAAKAGYHILSPSPRNTKADHASIFQAVGCKTLLTLAPPYSETIQTIREGLEGIALRIIHVPTIFDLLDKPQPHFPYPRIYLSAKDEILAIVHTSGSTNAPKVIKYTHEFAAQYNAWDHAPLPTGYCNATAMLMSRRMLTTFPYFHAGGLFICLCTALHNETIIVNTLAGVPPTVESIMEALEHVEVDGAGLPAPSIEQIGKDEKTLAHFCSKVDAVCYGGGDISDACGNAFASRVRLGMGMGSTETSTYPNMVPIGQGNDGDWKYIQPNPCANIEFQATSDPELFEAVLIKQKDPELLQPVFTIFPHLNEFRTRDLFEPHPTKPGLWKYRSRSDDTINSARGDMCNPVPFEQQIGLHPEVAAALMVGTGRYQKALLVQPSDDSWSTPPRKQEFVDRIWSTVEDANQHYPKLYRVVRSHILITEPGCGFQRAGKGTVQRAPTLALYRERIDQLYLSEGDAVNGSIDPYELHVPMVKVQGTLAT